MQEHVPLPGEEWSAQARGCFGELLGWLSGPEAGGLDHAGLEEELDARGRELTRQLLQDHLDLRAAREERREQVAGADAVARTRAEKGHQRALATVFGEAGLAVGRVTGRCLGKRQAEETRLAGRRRCGRLLRAAAAWPQPR